MNRAIFSSKKRKKFMTEKVLEIENLQKTYGDLEVLK